MREAAARQRHRQRHHLGGEELNSGDGCRIAALEQTRLDGHDGTREHDRCEHEHVAEDGGAAAAALGDEHDPDQRDARNRATRADVPGRSRAVAATRRHDDRQRADDDRAVADARVLDTDVLQQHHGAVPHRAGERGCEA